MRFVYNHFILYKLCIKVRVAGVLNLYVTSTRKVNVYYRGKHVRSRKWKIYCCYHCLCHINYLIVFKRNLVLTNIITCCFSGKKELDVCKFVHMVIYHYLYESHFNNFENQNRRELKKFVNLHHMYHRSQSKSFLNPVVLLSSNIP